METLYKLVAAGGDDRGIRNFRWGAGCCDAALRRGVASRTWGAACGLAGSRRRRALAPAERCALRLAILAGAYGHGGVRGHCGVRGHGGRGLSCGRSKSGQGRPAGWEEAGRVDLRVEKQRAGSSRMESGATRGRTKGHDDPPPPWSPPCRKTPGPAHCASHSPRPTSRGASPNMLPHGRLP